MEKEKLTFDHLDVYIGLNSEYPEVHNVCRHSIDTRSSVKTVFHEIGTSVLPDEIWWRQTNDMETTEFSLCRFLVPWLNHNKGYAVYMDDDFLWQGDIAEMMELVDPTKAVHVVKHKYSPKTKIKQNGNKQTNYKMKNWSSLMVFNCSHPDLLKLKPMIVNNKSGMYLHQFKWTNPFNIGTLPIHFNFLVGEYECKPQLDIRAYHFTLGGPWLDECKTQDFADKWIDEKRNLDSCR